ncbi:thioredoxin family protein [Flavobacterium agrisoli]|uniref:Thioredoxin family protein n=1 Tax=Flavobacterium agrisoli TaxID=2793066 RepID=A0A934PNS5_9FLAO|nr:thioredoxin family protein [Flavobacterium agrisoli]MBK0370600.1 thioredoxin family protein [Flavobacterium agrisoli]
MNSTVAKSLFSSHSYEEYRKIVTDLLTEGKTSGNEQSEDLVNYSRLNEKRMDRLEKTIQITPETQKVIKNLKHDYIWLVISEGWCGDAAQILPIIHKMAEIDSKKIDLRIVFRDENLELMDYFLTNKGRAIPKLIIINKATAQVENHWGPRPIGAAELIASYKKQNSKFDETIKTELQLWYLHDKGLSTQAEIIETMLFVERN